MNEMNYGRLPWKFIVPGLYVLSVDDDISFEIRTAPSRGFEGECEFRVSKRFKYGNCGHEFKDFFKRKYKSCEAAEKKAEQWLEALK